MRGSGERGIGDMPRPPERVTNSRLRIGRKGTAHEGKMQGVENYLNIYGRIWNWEFVLGVIQDRLATGLIIEDR
jgi:hypothetical protein